MKQTARISQVLNKANEKSAKRFAKQEEVLQHYREIAYRPASIKAVLIVAMMANSNHSKVNIV